MKKLIQSRDKFNHLESARDFIKHLDKLEGETRSGTTEKKKTSFSPSRVGYGAGTCARHWYYAFEGGDWHDEFRGVDIRNMANGTDVHERFQKFLEEQGIVDEANIEPTAEYEDPPIFGYIDAIVDWDDRKWVIEFKTTRTQYFEYRAKQMKAPSYHLVQILIYMYVKKIRQGMLVYEDKNTQRRCAIPVIWNDRYNEYMNELFDWMRTVYNETTGEDAKIPNRAYTQKSKECKGCPFGPTGRCWNDERGGEIELPRLPKPPA